MLTGVGLMCWESGSRLTGGGGLWRYGQAEPDIRKGVERGSGGLCHTASTTTLLLTTSTVPPQAGTPSF